MSKSTIQRWKSKGWAVRFQDGSIDLESTAARVDRERDGRGGKPTRAAAPHEFYSDDSGTEASTDESLVEARRRKEWALAKKAELELAKLEGELISVADAERVYVSVIAATKSNLEALPVKLAPRLAGLTCPIQIRTLIRAELADALRNLEDEPPKV